MITSLADAGSTTYQALSPTLLLDSILATICEPLLVLDCSLFVLMASRSFYRTFQLTPAVTEGSRLYELANGAWDIPALRELMGNILRAESGFECLEVTAELPCFGRLPTLLNARKVLRANHASGLILLSFEDISDRLEGDVRQISQLEGRDKEILEGRESFKEIIGNSSPMKRVLEQVEMVAPTDATVLILGETGTGKELVARAIHRMSTRRSLSFVTLNCAAIPTGLLESELFGYERGAFTGALSQKIGRFEMAHRGTLFLDEVGDIPLELQPKLLRALQEKSFERLGGTRTIPIEVRLVAATNRNLIQMMSDGLFRSDLYYRLFVFPILMPSLRDRPEDIPILVRHFTRKYAAIMNRHIDTIPRDTMHALGGWHWPGNVRELENFIERSVILSKGPILRAPIVELRNDAMALGGVDTLESIEREHIIRVLRESRGVVSTAALRLGLRRTTLNAMMRKSGISRKDF